MKVIAYKKRGLWLIYLICLFMGVGIIAMGITVGELFYCLFAGGLFTAISGWVVVTYLLLPAQVIRLDQNGVLHLPRGKTVAVSQLVDVSYRRASGRGIQYQWGTVTLSTYSETYRYAYVADCEAVAKELLQLLYRSGNEPPKEAY